MSLQANKKRKPSKKADSRLAELRLTEDFGWMLDIPLEGLGPRLFMEFLAKQGGPIGIQADFPKQDDDLAPVISVRATNRPLTFLNVARVYINSNL